MNGNNATGRAAGSVGLGGALHVADSCTNGICSSVEAVATSISMTGNFAYEVRGCILLVATLQGIQAIRCVQKMIIEAESRLIQRACCYRSVLNNDSNAPLHGDSYLAGYVCGMCQHVLV